MLQCCYFYWYLNNSVLDSTIGNVISTGATSTLVIENVSHNSLITCEVNILSKLKSNASVEIKVLTNRYNDATGTSTDVPTSATLLGDQNPQKISRNHKPLPLIVGASVGGTILIVFIILLACCVLKTVRKGADSNQTTSRNPDHVELSFNNYATTDNSNDEPNKKQDTPAYATPDKGNKSKECDQDIPVYAVANKSKPNTAIQSTPGDTDSDMPTYALVDKSKKGKLNQFSFSQEPRIKVEDPLFNIFLNFHLFCLISVMI